MIGFIQCNKTWQIIADWYISVLWENLHFICLYIMISTCQLCTYFYLYTNMSFCWNILVRKHYTPVSITLGYTSVTKQGILATFIFLCDVQLGMNQLPDILGYCLPHMDPIQHMFLSLSFFSQLTRILLPRIEFQWPSHNFQWLL